MAATCSVASPGVSFGNYNVFSAAPVNMNGTITITCSRVVGETSVTVSYEIFLGTGQSNSFVQRQMKSGANILGYNLYRANNYAVVWGDGTGSTRTVTGSLTLNNSNPTRSVSKTVFGRIPALQDAAVGIYGDNVQVTVNY
jgi:spore coat protein U-like protein